MTSGTEANGPFSRHSRHDDARRICRIVKVICAGDFAGLAGGDAECEHLYTADAPPAVVNGATAKRRVEGLKLPAILNPSEAAAVFAGHPWARCLSQGDWTIIYPIEFSPTAAPLLICISGRGAAPSLSALHDVAALVAPGVRDYRELIARRDDSMRYQLLARATDDVIWDWDVVAGRMDYNNNLDRVLGIDANELQQDPMRWFEYIHPDDRERIRNENVTALESLCDTWRAEYRIRRKNGDYARVLEKTSIVRDASGKPLRMLGAITDITVAREYESRITESEERYRLAFFDNPMPMAIYDEETLQYLDVNAAALRKYGYTRDEFLKLNVLDLILPELRSKVGERLALGRGSGPRSSEWKHVTKNGTVLILQMWSHPLRMRERPVRIVAAIDVTETRALEEQLREAQKMEAIGKLAGGVAHDFNNLLTIINGYAALLRQRIDPVDSMADYLYAIEGAGKRAAALTQQLLAFSRKQVLQPRLLYLNDVITASQPILRHFVRNNVDLRFKLDRGIGFILADAARVEQVLMNLVVNSRDAMPDGGRLTIETGNVRVDRPFTAQREEVMPGEYVALTVEDTGIGMTEELQRHIFEPFYSTKAPHASSGLGLSTVYGIVKQSNGHIVVKSKPGRGTSMKVFFPAATLGDRSGDAPALDHSQNSSHTQPARGAETICVVEDDERVRNLTASLLRELGYTVFETPSGEDALEVVRSAKSAIHLLMTDVLLPGVDGPALARAAVAFRPDLRVLFVSGFTDSEVDRGGVPGANVHYLAKPFDLAQLAAKVRQVLDEPRARRDVLIVDDDHGVRELFRAALRTSGYDTYVAPGPELAIEQFSSTPPALVITDLNMPGCAAEECIRQLRDAFPNAQMLCITGAALDLPRDEVNEWGVTMLLTKPVSPKALTIAVKSLIG